MKSLVILTSAVIVSSCATVFRGSSEMISFTSNPSGADVRLAVDTLEEYPTLPAVESDVPAEAQQPPVVAVGDAVSADSASVTAASTAPDNTTAVE